MAAEVREAVWADRDSMVELGMEALRRFPRPGVVPDRRELNDIAKQTIPGKQSLTLVAEENGEIVGSLIAACGKFPMHHARSCEVVQYYVKPGHRDGCGMRMLRMLCDWLDSRRGIRLCLVSIEHMLGEDSVRIQKMLSRLGFEHAAVDMIRLRPEVD